MNPVFADAFYFVACLNRSDQYHKKAVTFAQKFRGEIVTTTWIFVEVADALATSASRGKVASFIASLEKDAHTTVIEDSPTLFHRGLQLYGSRSDKDWTLTDCISFVVMKEQNILDALTGDRHFEQAGFNVLLR